MFFLDLETSCTSQALANLLGVIGHFLILLEIVVPIILIVSLVKHLITCINNPDEKVNVKRIINSIGACIIVFFLPIIVNLIMNVVGEKYDFSACWLLAREHKVSLNSTKYVNISDKKRKKIIFSASDYDNGIVDIVGDKNTSVVVGNDWREKLVAAARTQLGVPYNSMHYGPREVDNSGFGCAMFVSYCYNQVFFNGVSGQQPGLGGFYGSTYEYWGNVTHDGYDAYNKKFVEVSASEAQPGDVVAYTSGNAYASYSSCGHVALYIGNGRAIGACYSGVLESSVEGQADGRDIHYLKYVGS